MQTVDKNVSKLYIEYEKLPKWEWLRGYLNGKMRLRIVYKYNKLYNCKLFDNGGLCSQQML